ncbi:MAG: MBL fold metallo-hydrolase [Ruminococcaceae bacterium]|nr:MBL fold metallo-hydrolase [Oscillospiraceae bacterium]
MKITVLSDNIAPDKTSLRGEWGLSLYIESEEKKYLLDTGASSLFSENAARLGIDLSSVDAGILSHAHYDHSDGMKTFFSLNKTAPFYISSLCEDNCYGKRFIFSKYVGIKKGLTEKYADRIIRVKGSIKLFNGVHLICHTCDGLQETGKKAGLYKKVNGRLIPDDFDHEQSLVFETEKGLIIFNSCSHAGPENILNEIKSAFPEKEAYAYFGGLHLYKSSEKEVRRMAQVLKESSLQLIVTGHCTGGKAYKILKEALGDRLGQLHVGKVTEI